MSVTDREALRVPRPDACAHGSSSDSADQRCAQPLQGLLYASGLVNEHGYYAVAQALKDAARTTA